MTLADLSKLERIEIMRLALEALEKTGQLPSDIEQVAKKTWDTALILARVMA